LATGAAGRNRFEAIGDDNDGSDGLSTFGDGFEDGGALCADGEPSRGVLNVRARED
jgi:hypothetical protein